MSIAAVLLAGGCAQVAVNSHAPQTAVKRVTAPSPEAHVIVVRDTEFAFQPSEIRIPVGTLVRLELAGTGLVVHDLHIANFPVRDLRIPRAQHVHGQDIAVHAGPGEPGWVEFVATQPGTYQAICTYLGHQEAGMRATIIVE